MLSPTSELRTPAAGSEPMPLTVPGSEESKIISNPVSESDKDPKLANNRPPDNSFSSNLVTTENPKTFDVEKEDADKKSDTNENKDTIEKPNTTKKADDFNTNIGKNTNRLASNNSFISKIYSFCSTFQSIF